LNEIGEVLGNAHEKYSNEFSSKKNYEQRVARIKTKHFICNLKNKIPWRKRCFFSQWNHQTVQISQIFYL